MSEQLPGALNALAIKGNSYSVKLQDPRWQQKRRAIIASRNFCESCRQSGLQLQVHHNFYDRSREPWEYDSTELKVLCADCHEKFTRELLNFRRDILPRMTVQAMIVLNRSLLIGLKYNDALTVAHALGYIVSNPESAKRFATQFEK